MYSEMELRQFKTSASFPPIIESCFPKLFLPFLEMSFEDLWPVECSSSTSYLPKLLQIVGHLMCLQDKVSTSKTDAGKDRPFPLAWHKLIVQVKNKLHRNI